MPARAFRVPFTGLVVTASFFLLFGPALISLTRDWATSGEYGHGFLLVPIAVFLAWSRRVESVEPEHKGGMAGVVLSVTLFLLGTLAGEPFTQRLGMLGVLCGLTAYYAGWAQFRAWWLPFALLASSIPLPDVVLDTVTLPLQLFASGAAVWLLDARHIPVGQAGNVIFLPGQELFVAAACSGLRSVSALFGLTLLIAGTCVRSTPGRLLLISMAVPLAIGANVLRVFATGFGAYYFGPELARGLSHHAMAAGAFTLPLAVVGGTAWLIARHER
jgi:exosortase